jgi:hypothetical protein
MCRVCRFAGPAGTDEPVAASPSLAEELAQERERPMVPEWRSLAPFMSALLNTSGKPRRFSKLTRGLKRPSKLSRRSDCPSAELAQNSASGNLVALTISIMFGGRATAPEKGSAAASGMATSFGSAFRNRRRAAGLRQAAHPPASSAASMFPRFIGRSEWCTRLWPSSPSGRGTWRALHRSRSDAKGAMPKGSAAQA